MILRLLIPVAGTIAALVVITLAHEPRHQGTTSPTPSWDFGDTPEHAAPTEDEPLDFEQTAEFTAGCLAIEDFKRQKAVKFGPQQSMGGGMPDAVPLVLHPADDAAVIASNFDFSRHEQAIARAQANADLGVIAHQFGDVQVKWRQLIDPQRRRFRAIELCHFWLGTAKESVA